jgi:hypothetical protein
MTEFEAVNEIIQQLTDGAVSLHRLVPNTDDSASRAIVRLPSKGMMGIGEIDCTKHSIHKALVNAGIQVLNAPRATQPVEKEELPDEDEEEAPAPKKRGKKAKKE